MGDPAELSPAELDRIEDVLEDLEDLEQVEDPSPVVRRRLVAYRAILRTSREALPLEDPARGLLDDVLATAREAAGTTTLVPPSGPARQPWWKRWRKSLLVPGLAVAGAAALVLIIVQPRFASESAEQASSDRLARAEAAGAVERTEASAEQDESPPFPPAASTPSSSSWPEADADPKTRPGPVAQEPEDRSLETEASVTDAETQKPGAEKTTRAGEIGGGSPRWDLVARGDRARREGDCKRASAEYAMALTDDEARVRARAYAGLGLCDAKEGRYKEAADRYQRAKELDPEMETFIEDERPRGSRGGSSNASKARRSKKKSAPSKAKRKAALEQANALE